MNSSCLQGASWDISITLRDLDDYDFELREIYFGIYDRLTTPPQIRNTDGDPLVLHRRKGNMRRIPARKNS
jgi:hypothetical protein